MEPNQATSLVAAITIFGSGRLGPTTAALLGLLGIVIGGLALRRTRAGAGAGNGRRGAAAALVLGAVSVVLGGLFLATADGGPGTGNGVVGSVAALVLGPIAVTLGALARARRHEHGSTSIRVESTTSTHPPDQLSGTR